ncbi:MAG: hypothetical protein M0P57_02955 [Syntrophales bacterium]|jgi:integrase|nr:hypothetical protein [Syntrophales bacterium]MDY0045391.1 hypothetical protein [Syntrophales bacterium]
MLKDNPWKSREVLHQKKRSIELFAVEEFKQILANSSDHLAWALEVAYYTGVRPGRSELFALKWSRRRDDDRQGLCPYGLRDAQERGTENPAGRIRKIGIVG